MRYLLWLIAACLIGFMLGKIASTVYAGLLSLIIIGVAIYYIVHLNDD